MLEVAGGSGGQYGKTNLFAPTSHGWMDGWYVQEQKRGKRKGEVKDVEKKGTALCPHARSCYQNAGPKFR